MIWANPNVFLTRRWVWVLEDICASQIYLTLFGRFFLFAGRKDCDYTVDPRETATRWSQHQTVVMRPSQANRPRYEIDTLYIISHAHTSNAIAWVRVMFMRALCRINSKIRSLQKFKRPAVAPSNYRHRNTHKSPGERLMWSFFFTLHCVLLHRREFIFVTYRLPVNYLLNVCPQLTPSLCPRATWRASKPALGLINVLSVDVLSRCVFLLFPLLCGVDEQWHTPPCSMAVHFLHRQSLSLISHFTLSYYLLLDLPLFFSPLCFHFHHPPSYIVLLFSSHAHTTSTSFPVLSLRFPPLSFVTLILSFLMWSSFVSCNSLPVLPPAVVKWCICLNCGCSITVLAFYVQCRYRAWQLHYC